MYILPNQQKSADMPYLVCLFEANFRGKSVYAYVQQHLLVLAL